MIRKRFVLVPGSRNWKVQDHGQDILSGSSEGFCAASPQQKAKGQVSTCERVWAQGCLELFVLLEVADPIY